jgi:hypothetical protein
MPQEERTMATYSLNDRCDRRTGHDFKDLTVREVREVLYWAYLPKEETTWSWPRWLNECKRAAALFGPQRIELAQDHEDKWHVVPDQRNWPHKVQRTWYIW